MFQQFILTCQHVHDGEVFDSGYVLDAELDPDDDIIVRNRVIPGSPLAHPRRLLVLVRVLSTSEKLIVLILGHEDRMIGKSAEVSR